MTAGRRLELGLLLAGAGAYWIALALLGTYTARAFSFDFHFAWLPLAFLALWLILVKAAPQADTVVLVPVTLLSEIGMLVLLRISPAYAMRQGAWFAIGLLVCLLIPLALKMPSKLRVYKDTLGGLAVLLIGASLVFGYEAGGARLWLKFGSFSLQPAEPGKLFLILFLAAYLAEVGPLFATQVGLPFKARLKYVMPVVAFALVALLLFIRMKDLGAAGLFMGLFLAMFYLASGDRKLVGLGAGVFLVGAVAASFALPHVQNRLNAFWAPWVHYDGPGYQVAQALMSLGNGGLVGTGLGAGLGGIWLGANSLVPNALTDMPFVIICEELGAIAGLAVLVLFAALVARLFYGALTLRATFGKLVAAGIASLVALHVVLIVGGVLKVLPLTGITTPFISYGGSSLLTNFALVGLYLALTREEGRYAPGA